MTKTYSVAAALASILMISIALPASALSVGASASSTVTVSASNAKLSALITKADSDIAARISALNDLNARVQDMKNVSSDEKVSISNDVQTNITGLTSLQTKIDADTDLPTAKTDAQSIFGSFRIYALIVPRGWILASADRVSVITGLMTTLTGNIQTRLAAAQASGKDVTSLTASLTDANAKIADATAQSTAAQTGITSLVPDAGDKAKAASNHAALVAARADIKNATADITAARKDIAMLVSGLKAAGSASAAASSTTP